MIDDMQPVTCSDSPPSHFLGESLNFRRGQRFKDLLSKEVNRPCRIDKKEELVKDQSCNLDCDLLRTNS